MQTPAGFEMINGQAFVTSWKEVIFNPAMPYMMSHMLIASGLTASFFVAGVSAYRWLRNDKSESVLAALKTGVYLAAFLIPVQIVLGDFHGINTLKHQPAKIAAIEGIWETKKSVPLLLFAIPDAKNKTNHFEVGIPKLASLILTHDPDGEIKGLNEFEGEHPPVAPVFFAFRIMVGVGFLMLAVSWSSAFVLFRKSAPNKFVAKSLLVMTFSGWVALIAGWYVTEIGRQPYLVYGVLKTADAAASGSVVSGGMIATTLAMYLSLYVLLIISFVSVVFYLARKSSSK
jgi:cytochrome d ubiquinol oxidase subunit I